MMRRLQPSVTTERVTSTHCCLLVV